MSLKDALSKKTKTKKNKKKVKVVKGKKQKPQAAKTNKFRITTEIQLTGNQKNPLKSKMTGFFIKFSFKDDDKKEQIKQKALENNKTKKIKNKE